jgi:hypothetical protein
MSSPSAHPEPPSCLPGAEAPCVRQFRQTLLWPLRLIPAEAAEGASRARPWQLLRAQGEACPWQVLVDEYSGPGGRFRERHYNEFVTFLPMVQRFLYGEGRGVAAEPTPGASSEAAVDSPMRVFRRRDIARARVWLRTDDAPITLEVVHLDLYFFYDVDLVLLNLEVAAQDLPLAVAQELMYRLGRGYPSGWEADGQPQHCLAGAEWLDAEGRVLARSDAEQSERFMAHVAAQRAPRLAQHWAYLLQPLVCASSLESGPLRFRQIETYRMPLMAYLALDRPQDLTRADFLHLGQIAGAGAAEAGAPGAAADATWAEFERRHCVDRFWGAGGSAPYTRYLCTGQALVVVGDAQSAFFTCAERGVLAQFRHQHFLVFLIAHFQKAALLMFSDRLVEVLARLDVGDAASVRRFKRAIRGTFEGFLRFTHRYWFHEVSEQLHVRTLFRRQAEQLGVDGLYREVKERIADMSDYLEADGIRRQANTVVRLTVVTIFGLIGTLTTGFLGMNLLAEAESPWWQRLIWFGGISVAYTVIIFYSIAKAKRLSDFLDALTDERLTPLQKCGTMLAVWRRGE